jgi:hypothetical protein
MSIKADGDFDGDLAIALAASLMRRADTDTREELWQSLSRQAEEFAVSRGLPSEEGDRIYERMRRRIEAREQDTYQT